MADRTPVVDTYRQQLDRLASTTNATAQGVVTRWLRGDVSDDHATELLATVVNRSDSKAVTLADIYGALMVTEQTGKPVGTVGLVPRDQLDRLLTASRTVLDALPSDVASPTVSTLPGVNTPASDSGREIGTLDPLWRVDRFTGNEIHDTAGYAMGDVIVEQPLITGWVRKLSANPCQLCINWYRNGRVWPEDHPMPRHDRDRCVQQIVVTDTFPRQVGNGRIPRTR